MKVLRLFTAMLLLALPAFAQQNELAIAQDKTFVFSSTASHETESIGLSYLRWVNPEVALQIMAGGIFPKGAVSVLPTNDPLLAVGAGFEFLPVVTTAGGKMGIGASVFSTSGAADNPVILNLYVSMRRQMGGFALGLNAGWAAWMFDPAPDRDALRLALQTGFAF